MQHIRFEEEIHQSSIEELLNKLRQVNAPRCVYVSSPGGTFEFFSSLGPAIDYHNIVTVADKVCSAAVILYLLGRTRQALPDSFFFFHEVRTLVGPSNEITIADLESVREYAEMMSEERQDVYRQWLKQMNA